MKPSFRDYLLQGDDTEQDYYDEKPKFPSWVVRVATVIHTLHDPATDSPLPNISDILKDVKSMGTPGDNPDDLADKYLQLLGRNRSDRNMELLGF